MESLPVATLLSSVILTLPEVLETSIDLLPPVPTRTLVPVPLSVIMSLPAPDEIVLFVAELVIVSLPLAPVVIVALAAFAMVIA